MTTVTSLTADRMLAIEAASVVDGDVVGDNLILTKHDGSQINAGNVRGAQGPAGPQGALLPVISGVPVLDVGLANQIRAGRQLTAADFTNMGLSAPLGLWNLSDLSDVSGNGRNLLNKGAVPLGTGINGVANTAAQFSGSGNVQALYIPDTGAADPFRIRTGSWGCWFRTAKRELGQYVIAKHRDPPLISWGMSIGTGNGLVSYCSIDGTAIAAADGVSDVCDDRWHFGVLTTDATTLRLYVDGVLEGTALIGGPLFMSLAPVNIGSYAADSSTAGGQPHYGRIDEAFVTADVLSEDQIRNLYCAKIPHTLAVTPSRVSLNVHRRRKGATLVVADFPTQPLRLYNFSGGSLGDEGSNGVGLSDQGVVSVAGVDGSSGNAFYFNGGISLFSTDAGLPSALATKSCGCWFKGSGGVGNYTLLTWGQTKGTTDLRLGVSNASTIFATSGGDYIQGAYAWDSIWHFAVLVEDNTASDGIKRKLYLDGILTSESITLNPITLAGSAHFRIGSSVTADDIYKGEIDGVFVCDYALTAERIAQLYAKSLMTLASSPKNPGDHVEAMSTSSLLATFDTLESRHTIDLGVEP